MSKRFFILCLCLGILGVSFTNATTYDPELAEAYHWAYDMGITNKFPIENANMFGSITRAELAKMLANFSQNVLGKAKDTSKSCSFNDTDSLDDSLKNACIEACQFGIMGQGTQKFRPYDTVSRAEFGTSLSRILWGSVYDGGSPYYTNHLNSLKKEGIMDSISHPNEVKESRGYVMLMLMRSYNKVGNSKIKDSTESSSVSYFTSDSSTASSSTARDSDDTTVSYSLFGNEGVVVYTGADGAKYYYDLDFLKLLKGLADDKGEKDLSDYLKVEIKYEGMSVDMVNALESEDYARALGIDLSEIEDVDFEKLSDKEKKAHVDKVKKILNDLMSKSKKINENYLSELGKVVRNIDDDKFGLKDKYDFTKTYVESSNAFADLYVESLGAILESQLNTGDADDEEMFGAALGILGMALTQAALEAENQAYNEQWGIKTIDVLKGNSDVVNVSVEKLISSTKTSQKRPRDVARKNDLSQIQTAIITSQQDRGMWPGVNYLSGKATGGALSGVKVTEISNSLYTAGMSSIPGDPISSSVVYGLGERFDGKDKAESNGVVGDYLYLVATRNSVHNAGFVLMAKTETEGASNWVVCNEGKGLDYGYITNSTDLKNINTCNKLTVGKSCSAKNCTYSNVDELRYILLY